MVVGPSSADSSAPTAIRRPNRWCSTPSQVPSKPVCGTCPVHVLHGELEAFPAGSAFPDGLSRDIIHRRVEQMNAWGVRVRWSGRRPKLWKSVIDGLEKRRRKPKQQDHRRGVRRTTVAVLKSRTPARQSQREVRDGKISGDRVTEKMIAEHLYNPDIPDCDLVIVRPASSARPTSCRGKPPTRNDFVPELFPDCGRDVLWRSIDHYIPPRSSFRCVKR